MVRREAYLMSLMIEAKRANNKSPPDVVYGAVREIYSTVTRAFGEEISSRALSQNNGWVRREFRNALRESGLNPIRRYG
jgi:hypothetical protein